MDGLLEALTAAAGKPLGDVPAAPSDGGKDRKAMTAWTSAASDKIAAAFGEAPLGSKPKELSKWLQFALGDLLAAAGDDKRTAQQLHRLNKHLLFNSFLACGTAESAADLAVYGVLQPHLAARKFTKDEVVTFASLLRWAHHMETFSAGAKAMAQKASLKPLPALSPEAIPETYAYATAAAEAAKPKPKQQGNNQKAKPKQQQQQQGQKGEMTEAQLKREARKELNRQKQAAKAAAGGAAGGSGGQQSTTAEPSVADLDLRVGVITECEPHSNADSMYVEKIDFGEESGPRQVVSGLVKFVPIEEMRGRTVVCLCNLKPANLRGVKSSAMVLGAKVQIASELDKEGNQYELELLDAPEGAVKGDRVTAEGTALPEKFPAQLNPKRKIWEKLQPKMATNAASPPVVVLDGVSLVVPEKGPVTAKSLQKAQIG